MAGLCKATNIQRLLYHPSMQNAAKKAEAASKSLLSTLPTLVYEDGKHEIPDNTHEIRSKLSYDEESETDCIIFHSSGSSGTPKVR